MRVRNIKRKRMIGVGKIKQYGNVLDKPLNKGKTEVSTFICSFSLNRFFNLTDLAFPMLI